MSTIHHHKTVANTIKHWKHIAPIVHEPQNLNDYEKLASLQDVLLDVIDGDENHELIGLVEIISHLLKAYDHNQLKKTSGISALKFLMQQHHLKQSDLSDIGSQGVVSEILAGKRKLNIKQIKILAERFNVSLNTFID